MSEVLSFFLGLVLFSASLFHCQAIVCDAVGAQAPELTLQLLDPLRYLTKEVIDALGYLDEPLEEMVLACKTARKDAVVHQPKWTTRPESKRVVVHLKPRRGVHLTPRRGVHLKPRRVVHLKPRRDVNLLAFTCAAQEPNQT